MVRKQVAVPVQQRRSLAVTCSALQSVAYARCLAVVLTLKRKVELCHKGILVNLWPQQQAKQPAPYEQQARCCVLCFYVITLVNTNVTCKRNCIQLVSSCDYCNYIKNLSKSKGRRRTACA